MPTRSSGPLLGGQSSILLFITFFTFGMAAILVKIPPEMGGALVVGIIVFISTFMSAEAGLYLLIVSMLLSPEFGAGGLGDGTDTTSSRGVTLRAEDILLVLLGFAWLARTAVNKDLGLIRPTPLNAPIGSYIAICLLATLAGFIAGHVRGITGFFYVLKYVEYFIVYFLICNNVHSHRQIEKFLIVMLVTAFIVCITAIAQIPSGARVSAPFEGERGEPNTLGGYLILVGSVTACMALHLKNKKLTRYLWTLLGLMIIPFFATLSRGSYLALPFVYGTIAYFRPGKRIQIVAVLVLISAVGVIFMPKSVVERIMYTFNQGHTQQEKKKIGNVELDTSTSERLTSYQEALADGLKSPLWGYGVTGYGFLDAQYPRIWVETGLLGLFFFFSLLYKVFKESLKLFKETEIPLYRGLSMGLICGVVGLLVHGLGANTFTIVRVMEPFWLISGLVVSAYKLEMEDRASAALSAAEAEASELAVAEAEADDVDTKTKPA